MQNKAGRLMLIRKRLGQILDVVWQMELDFIEILWNVMNW
jgi:hypothetical protein